MTWCCSRKIPRFIVNKKKCLSFKVPAQCWHAPISFLISRYDGRGPTGRLNPTQPRLRPDRPFHNLRPSKSASPRFLTTHSLLINEFWGWQIVKVSARELNLNSTSYHRVQQILTHSKLPSRNISQVPDQTFRNFKATNIGLPSNFMLFRNTGPMILCHESYVGLSCVVNCNCTLALW